MTFKSLFTLKANVAAYIGSKVGVALGGEIGAAIEIAYNAYSTVDTVMTVLDVAEFVYVHHNDIKDACKFACRQYRKLRRRS